MEVCELGGEHWAVLQGGACGEGGDGSLGGRVSYGHLVFLIYAGGGVCYAVGQSAVVGKEEETCCGGIQAADGDETRERWQEVFDGGSVAAWLVLHGREAGRGFVQSEVGEGLGLCDATPVEEDLVLGANRGAEAGGRAVDRDPAGGDQGLRFAAGGGCARACEEGLEAH